MTERITDGASMLKIEHRPECPTARDSLRVTIQDPRATPTVLLTARDLLDAIAAETPEAMTMFVRDTLGHADRESLRAFLEPEQPDRDDPTERAQIDRSWALDKAKEVLPSVDRLAVTPLLNVADWIISGTRGDQ